MGKKTQGMKWPSSSNGAGEVVRLRQQLAIARAENEELRIKGRELLTEYNQLRDEFNERLDERGKEGVAKASSLYREIVNAQQRCVEIITRLLTHVALIPNFPDAIERYYETLQGQVDNLIRVFDDIADDWREQGDPINVWILGVIDVLERGEEGFSDLLELAKRRDPIAYDTRLIIERMVEEQTEQNRDKYTPLATQKRQQLKQRASEVLQTAAKDRPSFRQWGRIKEHYLASNKAAYDNRLMSEDDREVFIYLSTIHKTTLSDMMKNVPL